MAASSKYIAELRQHFERLDGDREAVNDALQQLQYDLAAIEAGKGLVSPDTIGSALARYTARSKMVLPIINRGTDSIAKRSKLLEPLRYLLSEEAESPEKPRSKKAKPGSVDAAANEIEDLEQRTEEHKPEIQEKPKAGNGSLEHAAAQVEKMLKGDDDE